MQANNLELPSQVNVEC